MPRATSKRRVPVWARWCIALGSILVIAAGGSVVAARVLLDNAIGSVNRQNLLGTLRAGSAHASVSGAKNILLVGVDTRADNPTMLSRSDSIILLHIPADHREGYLISLPRDSYVTIPAYHNGKVSYPGGKNKINAAYAYGSRGLTGAAAQSHGFELLAMTVKKLTGITPDAGAIIDFQGFQQVVQILGQVCMYVDEDTTSIHIGHTASGKFAVPYKTHPDGTIAYKVPGVTPNFYAKGNHCFTPTEALDYVRQRDLLADHDSDYGRQRHQQQFLKAILEQAEHEGLELPHQASRPAQGIRQGDDRRRRRRFAGGLGLRDAGHQSERPRDDQNERRQIRQPLDTRRRQRRDPQRYEHATPACGPGRRRAGLPDGPSGLDRDRMSPPAGIRGCRCRGPA